MSSANLRKHEFQSTVSKTAIITTPLITKCLPISKLSALHTLTHFIFSTSPLSSTFYRNVKKEGTWDLINVFKFTYLPITLYQP